MDNIYKSIRNDQGDFVRGRTKLFITQHDENGEIIEFNYGPYIVPEGSGNVFIVDDFVINQVYKLKLINGELIVKDGEVIEEPKRSKKELERERLMAQLAALDAEPEAVNINTADFDELITLEGIGETKAQAIIDYRDENETFETPEDLMSVPGIGESIYSEIQAQIKV